MGGSPRVGGNSDLLLDAALKGAQSAGARTEKLHLNHLRITPCQECGGCGRSGRCVIPDGMALVYPLLREADRLVVATPIFYGGYSAQLKEAIDRTQCCYVEKFVLGRPVHKARHPRKGILLAVKARRNPAPFLWLEGMVKIFFFNQEVEYAGGLCYEGIEEVGAIRKHPTALAEAFRAGQSLAGPGED